LCAAVSIAACASAPQAGNFGSGETLSGRLAVRVDRQGDQGPRSENAALGSVLAQARWALGSVVLVTPRGEQRFADLNALTREVLGESVPVAALFDWLRGRPWPGAPSESLPSTVSSSANGFSQLGWSVDLSKFADGMVVAKREAPPVVTVRALLDPS